MPAHTERRLMPYGVDEIYAVVADVERYPEFLPWCSRLKIRGREARDGKTVLTAAMTVAFQMLQESFTSRVTLDPAERRIDVEYLDGPFRYLLNTWRFTPAPQGGAYVDFHIEFEFKSRMLTLLMSAMFQRVVEKLVHAFEQRVRALHGPRRNLI